MPLFVKEIEECKTKIVEYYKEIIPESLLNQIIKELDENEEFNSLDETDLKHFFSYKNGGMFKYLDRNTTKEFLKALNETKAENKIEIIKEIKAYNINVDIFKELLEKAQDKENFIFKINYSGAKNIFEKLNEEEIKKILLNLDNLKSIDIDYISIDILKNLLEDEKFFNKITQLNFGSGKFFKQLDNECVKKILLNLDEKAIGQIDANNINNNLLNELISEAKPNDLVFKMDYSECTFHNYNNKNLIIKELDNKNIEKLLLNLDDKAIEKINFSEIPISFFKYLSENLDTKNEVIEKIKLLDFSKKSNDRYCFLLKNLNDQNINKLLEKLKLNEKIKKVSFENFTFLEETVNFCKESENYEFLEKYFTEKNTKTINRSINNVKDEFYISKLAEWIKELPENNELFKKIMYINYLERIDFFSLLLDKLDEKDIIKLLKNMENISKNIEDKNIKEILEKKIGNEESEKLIKQLKFKKLILEYNKEISISGDLISDFIDFIKEMDEEKVKKANLSNIFAGDNLEEVIDGILKVCPEKLPQFDIGKISESKLFSLIKEGKIKHTNILKNSNSPLVFLKDPNNFNIIQKIINYKNDKKLFSDKLDYNIDVLNELTILDIGQVKAFIQFYCNCQEPVIPFNEKKLEEALKKIEVKSLSEKFYNEYNKGNSELNAPFSKDAEGYLKNRQENLYLLMIREREKLNKRLERIKGNSRKREIEIEKEISILNTYIVYLESYRKDNFTQTLCKDDKKIKEIIHFMTKQYSQEVLRRTILDYNRRIEPFVKEYFGDEAEELTKNIEYALGILFNPDILSNSHKMEAQRILKENLGKISKKYKDFMKEKGVEISGSYLILSSVCNANNMTELNDALYSLISIRMVNDYTIYRNEKNFEPSTSSTLYRGLGSYNYSEIMSKPTEKSGRDKYSIFDMTFSDKYVNTYCETGGNIVSDTHSSNAGSFTSFSNNIEIAIERYGKSFTAIYSIPKNLQKSYFDTRNGKNEINGFDIPLDYRICSLVFNNKKISNVIFNEKMDFVVFRLTPKEDIKINDKNGNIKIYKAGKTTTVTKEELGKIIMAMEDKKNLVDFFDSQLTIERVFDRDRILTNEEKQETQKIQENLEENLKKYESNSEKTLEVEKRLERINATRKPFSEEKSKIIENNAEDNKIITYAIPDTHGSIDALKQDLVKIGIIIDDGKGEYIYYRKNDYKLTYPIYEKPNDEENYIKVPKLIINNDFKGKVTQLGDLVDNHNGEQTKDSLACLATSILLSRQLGNKYTTLIGNHEIAHIAIGGYTSFKDDNAKYKDFIIEAIKNSEIKLFQHTPGTNIINSHVPLLRDNILNFLNIASNNNVFISITKELNRLAEIMGLEKSGNTYKKIEGKECLLDKTPPKEEDIQNFVDLSNKLFTYTVINGQSEILLKTLVNDNRLQVDENGLKKLKNIPIEELEQSTFKGITNIVGHDATPIGLRGGKYNKELQKEYYTKTRILFIDEWQGRNEAKCVKIETDKERKNSIYFYREENKIDDKDARFVENNFDNNKKVKKSKEKSNGKIEKKKEKKEEKNIEKEKLGNNLQNAGMELDNFEKKEISDILIKMEEKFNNIELLQDNDQNKNQVLV